MAPFKFLLPTLAGLGALLSAQVASGYTWPDEKIDYLEQMLYEQSGRDAHSPASFVIPCGKVPFGVGRNGAAEWLRTAYHDMATADVVAGTGGIDASIGFELDRDENPGSGFEETLENLAGFLTVRTSMADLIAMGALFAVGGCSGGKIILPFRGGRIDATGPGPTGVPKPEEDIESHTTAFARQGFNASEMIALVACGHTLGGVHGVDFPEIVDVVNDPAIDDNTQDFDRTVNGTGAFDNDVAVDFVNNGTQNPLAFGHNVTTRSDARIFSSDGGDLIGRMAESNDFFLETCSSLLERMIDTVPKEVTLTSPIEVIEVKPSALFATINANGTMTMTGRIRLLNTLDPNRQVKIHFHPREGQTGSTIVGDAATSDRLTVAAMWGDYPSFSLFEFSTEIPLSQGVSGFDVEVIDTSNGTTNSTMYTNGGNGFPFDDTIVTQKALSCNEQNTNGALNLTVAVRDDAMFTSLKALVQLPSPLDSLTPTIATTTIDMVKTGAMFGANYTLYTALQLFGAGAYTLIYDLVASNDTHSLESVYNQNTGIPSCPFGFPPSA